MPKVSAIISAYYAEEFIEGRIDNLLRQSLMPEVVVVCQRGTAEHLTATKYRADEVKVVLTDDVPTIYTAWNLGIQASTGDYLTNANSDDRLYPGALAKLAKALDDHPKYAVAYSDADVVEALSGPPVNRYEWDEGGLNTLLIGCFMGPWPMWRRSLHDKYGLFDAEMYSAGDYEFWLRLASKGERFFHLREVTGAYLSRAESAEHKFKLRSLWEQARAQGRYREGVNELWTKPSPMTD